MSPTSVIFRLPQDSDEYEAVMHPDYYKNVHGYYTVRVAVDSGEDGTVVQRHSVCAPNAAYAVRRIMSETDFQGSNANALTVEWRASRANLMAASRKVVTQLGARRSYQETADQYRRRIGHARQWGHLFPSPPQSIRDAE